MIHCPAVRKRSIRFHYDLTTLFYRLLWGEHIHHGLWQKDESPKDAQVRLTREVARLAGIEAGESVLDVGCGMGGSSLYLARHHGCQVTGVTISGVQRRWASWSAWRRGLGRRTTFVRADAEQMKWEPEQFDVIWSIECTEHLFDKAAFFERAARWLRPGGRMAICAWLEGTTDSPHSRQLVMDVCEGFFCPSLGSMNDYRQWMSDAGLEVQDVRDWTDEVARTWEICQSRACRPGLRRLAYWIDRETGRFLDRFATIHRAYTERAMQYGCLVARKPP